jgi:hypothetical protein
VFCGAALCSEGATRCLEEKGQDEVTDYPDVDGCGRATQSAGNNGDKRIVMAE